MQESKISVRQAVLFVLIAMISIQSGASFAKSMFHIAGPIGTTLLRISFAAVMLFFVFKPWRYKISKKEMRLILGYGASLGLMNLTFYISLERIPLGVAVAIEFVGPLLVAVFGSRKIKDFAWVLLAIVGLSLLLPLKESFSQGVDFVGAIFALIAGLFWGVYIIMGGKLSKTPGTVASSYGMVVAAVTVLPFGIYKYNSELLSPQMLGAGLVIALLSSAIPYSLEMFAMKAIPSKNFGILMSLEPVLAATSGFLILHESLDLYQMIAIAFIIAASFGSVVSSSRTDHY